MLGIVRLTPNIAVKGTATQSSRHTWSGLPGATFDAFLANDGNFSTDEIDCAITSNTAPSWWQVDLLDTYDVSKVAITMKRKSRKSLSSAFPENALHW